MPYTSDGTRKFVWNTKPPLYRKVFEYKSGFMARWGATKDDDPPYSPVGPEILDLEISINGCPNECEFCYKANTNTPATNMSFETFKQVFSKFNHNLDSIAFGITGVQTNPDFIKMLKYSNEHGVVPNFTLSGIDITREIAEEIVKYIGAVAVSAYESDKNVCYDTVKLFTGLGIEQTNIHLMVSRETLPFVYEVLNDVKTDPRLAELSSVVFLGVKPKGRAAGHFHCLSQEEFGKLIQFGFDNKIQMGFDSCSAPKFVRTVLAMDSLTQKQKDSMIQGAESCESFGLFSAYVNVHGDYFPCSFAEGEGEWKEGISVLKAESFLEDVWFSDKVNYWRQKSLESCDENGCRRCLIFKEVNGED